MVGRNDIIINCDLGEYESPDQTEELMRCIDAANIASGGHAGDEESIKHCLELCKKYGVLPGVHPGLSSEGGRGDVNMTANELSELLHEQVGVLQNMTEPFGLKLHHIKLHGSLYHAVEKDDALAQAYMTFLNKCGLELKVFSLSGGLFAKVARDHQIQVLEEGFLDRAYEADGSLRSRKLPDAVICDESFVAERMNQWMLHGTIKAHDGNVIRLTAQTFCVHSDSPNAPELLRSCLKILSRSRC